MRNKPLGDTQPRIDAMRMGLQQIHEKTGSWRLAGFAIRSSGAYARMLANGQRTPTPRVLDAWREWQKANNSQPRRRYYRPCLSTDPVTRRAQLLRLLEELP